MILRRTLRQTAALQKAQAEWKAQAKAYRKDLQQLQALLTAEREAVLPAKDSDAGEGNSSDLGEEA